VHFVTDEAMHAALAYCVDGVLMFGDVALNVSISNGKRDVLFPNISGALRASLKFDSVALECVTDQCYADRVSLMLRLFFLSPSDIVAQEADLLAFRSKQDASRARRTARNQLIREQEENSNGTDGMGDFTAATKRRNRHDSDLESEEEGNVMMLPLPGRRVSLTRPFMVLQRIATHYHSMCSTCLRAVGVIHHLC
jgi:hypothetical protein